MFELGRAFYSKPKKESNHFVTPLFTPCSNGARESHSFSHRWISLRISITNQIDSAIFSPIVRPFDDYLNRKICGNEIWRWWNLDNIFLEKMIRAIWYDERMIDVYKKNLRFDTIFVDIFSENFCYTNFIFLGFQISKIFFKIL